MKQTFWDIFRFVAFPFLVLYMGVCVLIMILALIPLGALGILADLLLPED